MNRPYLFFRLILFVSVVFAWAQEPYSLQALLNLALKQNADIISQTAQTEISRLEGVQSRSELLPNLSADGGYIYSTSRNGLPDFVGANGLREGLAYLSLHQSIFNAGVWGQYHQSSLEQNRQDAIFHQAKQDIISLVVKSYFSLLKLQGTDSVYQENLQSFKLMYEQSKLLFNAGTVPEIDVKKSRVEYLMQKNGLLNIQKKYRDELNHLKELVGLSISDVLTVKKFPPREMKLDSLAFYVDVALRNNPQWQVLQYEHEQAELNRQTALLKFLPTIDADIYYGWDANPPLSRNNNGWQAMLNLHIPLWQWGAQKASYEIAGLKIQKIDQEQLKLKKQIQQQVLNDFHEAQIQQEEMNIMVESRSESEQALKMAQIGYQEGTLTNLELVNAQKLYTQSKIGYLTAWYDFYIAKALLFHSAGMLTDDMRWLNN